MKRDLEELKEACSRLRAAGYEVRRVEDFDGAAIAIDYWDRGEPIDVGIIMTHDALDHVRRTARVALLRELAAELDDGPDTGWSANGDYEQHACDEFAAKFRARADEMEKNT